MATTAADAKEPEPQQPGADVNPTQPALSSEELKRNKQAEQVMGTITGTVFPTHKPRDIGYGLKSGLFNIGAGVAAGATAMVTMPIVGARQGGATGFAQGLGAGLAMGVALPVTGVFNGLRQISRGVMNTAEAVEAQMKGKVWDREKEVWVDFVAYNLKDDAERVLNSGGSGGGGSDGGGGGGGDAGGGVTQDPNHKVKDMHYYELLSVGTGANAGQIKKAYYKEARRCHPDRNPDDKEAHAKFQALGEAYRVLSSDQLRAYYDKHGREEDGKGGMGDSEMQMDMAKLFFAVMFGGDKFEPYIGQLGLSAFMDALTGEMAAAQGAARADGPSLDLDEMKKVQVQREVRCALALASRLEPCVAAAALRLKHQQHKQAKTAIATSVMPTASNPLPGCLPGALAAEVEGGEEADPATTLSSPSPSSPTSEEEEADVAEACKLEAEFAAMVKDEVEAMSKATFGEPLLHAIGSCYVGASDKYLGYAEGFLGIEGWAASMKQKTRESFAYMDVASKGIKSIGKVQHMSDIAEKDKARLLEDPEPPTESQLEAQLSTYTAMSVKELREACKERPNSFPTPGTAAAASAAAAEKGLDTSGCVEKSDIVAKLVANDAEQFAHLLASHVAWKEGGCEGPPPVRPQRPKSESAAAAAKKKEDKEDKKKKAAAAAKEAGGGAEEEEAEEEEDEEEDGGGAGGLMGGMDEGMSAEAAKEMKSTMETSLPVFLETMVAASLLDVEVTLKGVCKRVLNDHGVDEHARAARARGLRKLGRAMEKAVGLNKAARGEVEAKHVLEGTMMRTMAKAQGQEVDDDDLDQFAEDAQRAEKARNGEDDDEEGGGDDGVEADSAGAAAAEAAEVAAAVAAAAVAAKRSEEEEVAAAVAAVAAAKSKEAAAAVPAMAAEDDLD